jgi:hypothetical protein
MNMFLLCDIQSYFCDVFYENTEYLEVINVRIFKIHMQLYIRLSVIMHSNHTWRALVHVAYTIGPISRILNSSVQVLAIKDTFCYCINNAV